jgi:hypothetical protein
MRKKGQQGVDREDGRNSSAVTGSLARTGFSDQSTIAGHDPVFLFACQLEWRNRRNFGAYQALVAALDDSEKRIRAVAEMLLHRSSPRPQRERLGISQR